MADTDRRAATAALTALAEHGIPPDVQELLVRGKPNMGVKPGALSKAAAAVISSYAPAAEIERLKAALTKINDAAEKGKPTEKLLNWISHIADEAVNARAVDEQKGSQG